jgi:hypothetical protein
LKRALVVCAVLLLAGCHKSIEIQPDVKQVTDTAGFTKYTINAGAHYATTTGYKPVETASLSFAVRFDSSAIYQTASAENQYDINKLYGFSDNKSEHHLYSARFGWRWSNNALRLFAYVYNEGNVTSKEVCVVPIDATLKCRIDVAADTYKFYCNEYQVSLPRKSTTTKAEGYLLYPYFGGDEAAPHEITIWIKDL